VFRDWSGGDPACLNGIVSNGSNTICRANFGPTLLLVDDDDNGPNVLSSYTDALDVLGVPYDVWDTEQADKEPRALDLADYTRVIWFSGNASGFAGPGTAAEAHLAAWLVDGSGCLLLSSQDYYTYRGLTPFMSSYLGVASAVNEVDHTQVSGTGSVFGGLGPYALSFPFDNHSDSISPASGAELAFSGTQGNAGVQVDNSLFRSLFLSFPLETLPTPGDRQAVLGRFFDFCAVPRVLTGDVFEDGFE
jgi:hypothetical protein